MDSSLGWIVGLEPTMVVHTFDSPQCGSIAGICENSRKNAINMRFFKQNYCVYQKKAVLLQPKLVNIHPNML